MSTSRVLLIELTVPKTTQKNFNPVPSSENLSKSDLLIA
jgi:hypothetical protein